jgi:hypothetical protein
MTPMMNVRDECDLPEDDGYDLFTRETEVERRRKDDRQSGPRHVNRDGGRDAPDSYQARVNYPILASNSPRSSYGAK